MDEASYLRLIRGEARGPLAHAARLGLSAAASGYGLAVVVRNAGYDRGWREVHRAPVPVVSVGNLTLGGTGKTPMVEWVARWYRARGGRVAILSRGYGRAEGMNDEGRVLAENLPDVPPYEDPDRVRGALRAVEESESQLIVLDDGFQHRRLARDLDIVLLDALEPFGLGRLFPRGLLREPVRALRRAGVVVLSRADLVAGPDRAAIRAEAERRAGPLRWAEARHAPRDLVDDSGRALPVEGLATRSVVAFCGVGNPEGFRRTLTPLCGRVLGFRTFPDHHPYSAVDVADLAAWARGLGADLALTTQKDFVKLRTATLGQVPLRALRIGLEVLSGASTLDEALMPLLPPP
ncbi:MAG: tetraacyldisaccharide 4'-kinase [Planctomycetaceae bacterium]|nr:tetraacyldisaccharide 4'-kinase [Planctomycetaceae bacterium]